MLQFPGKTKISKNLRKSAKNCESCAFVPFSLSLLFPPDYRPNLSPNPVSNPPWPNFKHPENPISVPYHHGHQNCYTHSAFGYKSFKELFCNNFGQDGRVLEWVLKTLACWGVCASAPLKSEEPKPSEKSAQHAKVHLNKFYLSTFCWVPYSFCREAGESSRELF